LLTSFFRVAVEMAKGCLQAASWLISEASDTSPDPFEKCVSADEMVIERNPYVKRQQSSRGWQISLETMAQTASQTTAQ